MEVIHVTEFLNRFSVDELVNRGILRGTQRILNYRSVLPLMKLMAEHDIARLEDSEGDWFLTSQGEFRNRYSIEEQSGNIQELENVGNVFKGQNRSVNPHYVLRPDTRSDSEGDASSELKFGLERDLQQALRDNIQQLDPGLKIIDSGDEKSVEAGRIDITAEDADGYTVVIELKAGKAGSSSIEQVLSYVGSLAEEDPSRPVRGILVAGEFTRRTVLAANAVPDLSLKTYSFEFSFRDP